MKKNLHQKNTGFTLIEIMVAVSIFAMVMMVGIGAVLSIVAANKKAQALNSVITNLNFAIEGMVRDLRTGYNYDCGGEPGDGLTDCATEPSDLVAFTSAQSNGETVTYSKSGSAIYKRIGNAPSYALTAPEVTVDKLNFYVVGTPHEASQDSVQPKILIIIEGKYNGYGNVAGFSLQTLVSQRKLDI